MNPRQRAIAFCHPDKQAKALNMCSACYQRFLKAKIPYCRLLKFKFALCHPSKYNKVNGLCGSCYDKVLKRMNHRYKQRQANNTSQWLKRHPERAKQYLDKQKAKPNYYNWIRYIGLKYRLKKLQVTTEQYETLLQVQNHQCAICHKPLIGKDLHLDHCHTTGGMRGLLCSNCNMAIGLLKDNVQSLKNAIQYLNHPPFQEIS